MFSHSHQTRQSCKCSLLFHFFLFFLQTSICGLHWHTLMKPPHGDRSLASLSSFNHVMDSTTVLSSSLTFRRRQRGNKRTNATDNADLHVDAVVRGDHTGPHGSLFVGLGDKQLHGQDWSGGASRHPGTEAQRLLRPGGRSHVCWTHRSDQRWFTADLNREKPDEKKWATHDTQAV